jgi:hypothetical protein
MEFAISFSLVISKINKELKTGNRVIIKIMLNKEIELLNKTFRMVFINKVYQLTKMFNIVTSKDQVLFKKDSHKINHPNKFITDKEIIELEWAMKI